MNTCGLREVSIIEVGKRSWFGRRIDWFRGVWHY
jgi:hypothetical protein